MKKNKPSQAVQFAVIMTMLTTIFSCKQQTIPPSGSVASLNIVDALPTSLALIPVQGTTGPVYTDNVPGTTQYGLYQNFKGAPTMAYGTSFLINPVAGSVQLYLVQRNSDTLVVNGHVGKKHV